MSYISSWFTGSKTSLPVQPEKNRNNQQQVLTDSDVEIEHCFPIEPNLHGFEDIPSEQSLSVSSISSLSTLMSPTTQLKQTYSYSANDDPSSSQHFNMISIHSDDEDTHQLHLHSSGIFDASLVGHHFDEVHNRSQHICAVCSNLTQQFDQGYCGNCVTSKLDVVRESLPSLRLRHRDVQCHLDALLTALHHCDTTTTPPAHQPHTPTPPSPPSSRVADLRARIRAERECLSSARASLASSKHRLQARVDAALAISHWVQVQKATLVRERGGALQRLSHNKLRVRSATFHRLAWLLKEVEDVMRIRPLDQQTYTLAGHQVPDDISALDLGDLNGDVGSVWQVCRLVGTYAELLGMELPHPIILTPSSPPVIVPSAYATTLRRNASARVGMVGVGARERAHDEDDDFRRRVEGVRKGWTAVSSLANKHTVATSKPSAQLHSNGNGDDAHPTLFNHAALTFPSDPPIRAPFIGPGTLSLSAAREYTDNGGGGGVNSNVGVVPLCTAMADLRHGPNTHTTLSEGWRWWPLFLNVVPLHKPVPADPVARASSDMYSRVPQAEMIRDSGTAGEGRVERGYSQDDAAHALMLLNENIQALLQAYKVKQFVKSTDQVFKSNHVLPNLLILTELIRRKAAELHAEVEKINR